MPAPDHWKTHFGRQPDSYCGRKPGQYAYFTTRWSQVTCSWCLRKKVKNQLARRKKAQRTRKAPKRGVS